jgi:hypothetical protein
MYPTSEKKRISILPSRNSALRTTKKKKENYEGDGNKHIILKKKQD